jgi:predicted secreted protein
MHARSKLVFAALMVLAVAAALALVACSSSASSSASSASTASSASSGATSSVSASSTATGSEDVVNIALDYSAGTGYEWQCAVEPDGVVKEVGKETEDLAKGQNTAGGSLRDIYTFRAVAPGEVVITFKLERPWEEGEAAEEQVYAFTVSSDLKMVLNPYKSDFENEPTWGSNS